jgi:hypothetical protein
MLGDIPLLHFLIFWENTACYVKYEDLNVFTIIQY